MVRDLTIYDLVRLEKKAQFPLENIISKPKLVQKTFEDDKGIVGSIIVSGTVELNAIFNDERSIRDRVSAMKQIYDILYKELHPKGYNDIRATTIDQRFADILVKHFDFQYAIGHSLFRRY